MKDYWEHVLQQKEKELEYMLAYIRELENYVCECISEFAKRDIAPPEPTQNVAKKLQQLFVDAVSRNT